MMCIVKMDMNDDGDDENDDKNDESKTNNKLSKLSSIIIYFDLKKSSFFK
jgi:hypothetical protein